MGTLHFALTSFIDLCRRYTDADDGPKFDPIYVGVINMIGYFTMFLGIGNC